jgi:WD40 repeat protein
VVIEIPGLWPGDTLGVDCRTVYFSPDGRTLATFQEIDPGKKERYERQHLLNLWDVNSGRKKLDITGWGPGLVFSPDGQAIACRFLRFSKIQVWEVNSGRELAAYPELGGPNWLSLVFSPEGKLLALGKHDVLWDVADHKIVKNFLLNDEQVIAAGQNTILVATNGDVVKVWDLATGTMCAERPDIPTRVVRADRPTPSVRLTSDRRFLLYRPDDIYVFDFVLKQKHFFPALVGNTHTTSVAIAPDGQTVALGMYYANKPKQRFWWSWFTDLFAQQAAPTNYHVALKTFPAREEIMVLDGWHSPVFSPDGQTLAVVAEDGKSVQLWDTRKPIGKILGLAGLAAVATLLAFKAFGRLRRKRSTPISEAAVAASSGQGALSA